LASPLSAVGLVAKIERKNATTEKGAKIGDHLKRLRVLVGFIWVYYSM